MSHDLDNVSVLRLARRFWTGRYWLVGSTLLFGLMAAALAFSISPQYRSEIVLAPVSEDDNVGAMAALQGQFGNLMSFIGGANAGGSTGNEVLALLNSREFVQEFIEDEGLLKVFFADKWDEKHQRWMVDDARDTPTLQDGYVYFADTFYRVRQDRLTSLISVSIDWYDSNEAVRWANKIVARLNKKMRERALHDSEASIGYLREALKNERTTEIRDGLYRLIETQTKRAMFAKTRDDFAVRVIVNPLPSDSDRPLRPKRTLMIIIGSFAGLLIGVGLVLSGVIGREKAS